MTVVVLGGGPAGLAAAVELRRLATREVLVVERESEPGGIPRHAQHQGFGIRDLRRPLVRSRLRAPATRELAAEAGAEIRTETHGHRLVARRPARAHRPARPRDARPRRRDPRDRMPRAPALGPARARVAARGRDDHGHAPAARVPEGARPVGERALIVGAEHVSFSALVTLGHGGARAVGMTTELPRHQTLRADPRRRRAALAHPALDAHRGDGDPRSAARRGGGAHGPRQRRHSRRSSATPSCSPPTGSRTTSWRSWAGSTWIRARAARRVDTALRTSREGVFAAGNLLHGAEPADVAALSGRHAAAARRHTCGAARGRRRAADRVRAASPLDQPERAERPAVAPAAGDASPLRSTEFVSRPRIQVVQDGRTLWDGRIRRLVPGRSARLAAGWTAAVDPGGGPVRVRVVRRG